MTKREQPEVTKIAVVDIETLGKGAGAKIASIGCAILDVKTLQIGKAFYEVIETKDQHTRYAEADTVEFWLTQAVESPDAFNELFTKSSKPKVSLESALKDLSAWLKSEFNGEPINMFGNGPEFDNVILNDAYELLGIQLPWSYWCNQSVRTMLLMYRLVNGNQQPDIKFEGVKHHALFDAVHEAKIIAETLRFVRDGIESVKVKNVIGDLSDKLEMYQHAILQIANHVGAKHIHPIHVADSEKRGYSQAAAEIIRKIDASKGDFIGASQVLGDIYAESAATSEKLKTFLIGHNWGFLQEESGKDSPQETVDLVEIRGGYDAVIYLPKGAVNLIDNVDMLQFNFYKRDGWSIREVKATIQDITKTSE